MSFYLQQKLQQKNNKRKKHDNNIKAKKLKHIQQQIRATLTKEFEHKYAEKEQTSTTNAIQTRIETEME